MNKRAFGVLSACFLIIFLHYGTRYSYGIFLPQMLSALSITKTQAGMIYFAYFIAYTAFSPIMGLLSDKYDLRIILTVFVLLMAGGTFLMGYSTSPTQASLFFCLAGVGCSACWTPVMVLAQKWVGEKRRGMSLAFVDAGSSMGIVVMGAVMPLIVMAYDWRTGWMTLGVLGFVLAVLCFFLIRNPPESESDPMSLRDRNKTGGISYKHLFSNRFFWLIGIAYFFTGFAVIVPFTFISTYAVQELSVPYESASLLVTLIGAGGVTGKLIFGPLSDKLGRVKIMVIAAIFIAGGNVAIAFNRGWLLMVFTFIYGLGYGSCWSMYAACASDFFSKQAAGRIIGLWTFYLGVGTMIAPVLAGRVADITGTLMWAFLIAAAAGFASLLLLLPMLKMPQACVLKVK
jgi:OFA family oxalate/formate antiporter-like MFS transporter